MFRRFLKVRRWLSEFFNFDGVNYFPSTPSAAAYRGVPAYDPELARLHRWLRENKDR